MGSGANGFPGRPAPTPSTTPTGSNEDRPPGRASTIGQGASHHRTALSSRTVTVGRPSCAAREKTRLSSSRPGTAPGRNSRVPVRTDPPSPRPKTRPVGAPYVTDAHRAQNSPSHGRRDRDRQERPEEPEPRTQHRRRPSISGKGWSVVFSAGPLRLILPTPDRPSFWPRDRKSSHAKHCKQPTLPAQCASDDRFASKPDARRGRLAVRTLM